MSYRFKDQSKWNKIKELFPWVTKEHLNQAVSDWKNSSNSYIFLEDTSHAENVRDRISISYYEIEEVEDLLLDKWYPKEKFNGNPDNHILLIEYKKNYYSTSYKDPYTHFLPEGAIRFKFISLE